MCRTKYKKHSTPRTDNIDHDLDLIYIIELLTCLRERLCRICIVHIHPRKYVLDRAAGYTAPTQQHELDHTDHTDHTDHADHTDHTDQESTVSALPGRSRSSGNRWSVRWSDPLLRQALLLIRREWHLLSGTFVPGRGRLLNHCRIALIVYINHWLCCAILLLVGQGILFMGLS